MSLCITKKDNEWFIADVSQESKYVEEENKMKTTVTVLYYKIEDKGLLNIFNKYYE